MWKLTTRIINQLRQWCAGRNGWVRLPLLLGFAYIFLKLLQDPAYVSILGGLNLGIHEFGHLVFSLAGEFIGIAGGTIMQLAAPFYGVYNFIKHNDYFSAVLCFAWLSTSLYNVAAYAADAQAMALPLVSPLGAHVYHDWNYLLLKTGLLAFDAQIGVFLRGLGFVSMAFALSVCGWMVVLMLKRPSNPSP